VSHRLLSCERRLGLLMVHALILRCIDGLVKHEKSCASVTRIVFFDIVFVITASAGDLL
jgi:hypothetical protein